MAETRLWRTLAWCTLIAIVAIGGYLRSLGLHGSLWLDELHTAWTVSGNLSDVAPRAMLGNQPPVVYWPLWIYVQVAGVSEFSLRLPSLIASLASIVLVYLLVERWTKSLAAALLAAAALAIQCDSFAFYATEARVYALAQLVAIAHLLIFTLLLETGERRFRIAWVMIGCLLLYLHYTLALLLVAQLVAWCVIRSLKPGSDYSPQRLLVDVGLIGVGCLPAIPHLLQIAARRSNWELFIDRPEFEDLWNQVPHEQALWWMVAGWLGIVTVFWWKGERPVLAPVNIIGLTLALSWLCIPMLVAWSLSRWDLARIFFPRYLVYVLPAGGALLGVLAAMLPKAPLRALYSLFAVMVLSGWNLWLCQAMYGGLSMPREENWRDAIAALNERSWQPDEPLFVATNLIESNQLRTSDDPRLHEFCLYPLHAAYPLHAPGAREEPLPISKTGELNDAQRRLIIEWLVEHDAVVFVVRGSEELARDVAADVVQSLDGEVAASRFQDFGLVWLFEIRPVRSHTSR